MSSSAKLKIENCASEEGCSFLKSQNFENVKFPHHASMFRVSLLPSSNADDGTISLRLEDKGSKMQWQMTTNEIELEEQFKMGGVPVAAVLDFLVRALHGLDEKEKEAQTMLSGATVASADLTQKKPDLLLVLKVEISHKWSPKFEFLLKAVTLDPVTVLESKLKDAEDKIHLLRAEVEQLKQCPVSITVKGQMNVTWNSSSYCLFEAVSQPLKGCVELFPRDNTQVIIKKAGKVRVEANQGALSWSVAVQKAERNSGFSRSEAFTVTTAPPCIQLTLPGSKTLTNFQFLGEFEREFDLKEGSVFRLFQNCGHNMTPTNEHEQPYLRFTFLETDA